MPNALTISNSSDLLRYNRSLFNKIMLGFHQACDQNDIEVARALLGVLERVASSTVARPQDDRRRNQQSCVAAHERLWQIRSLEVR